MFLYFHDAAKPSALGACSSTIGTVSCFSKFLELLVKYILEILKHVLYKHPKPSTATRAPLSEQTRSSGPTLLHYASATDHHQPGHGHRSVRASVCVLGVGHHAAVEGK